jgi:hypothetical protein
MAVRERPEGVYGRFRKNGVDEPRGLSHVRADVDHRSDLQTLQPGAVESPVLMVVDPMSPDAECIGMTESEQGTIENGG